MNQTSTANDPPGMLYEICPVCRNKGMEESIAEGCSVFETCEVCNGQGFIPCGLTVQQLNRLRRKALQWDLFQKPKQTRGLF
jgi:DnaJ-class molecular chaperone